MNWWSPSEWGEIMVTGAQSKIYALITELFEGIVLSSYWICIIGGMIGIVLYIFGYKKGKNYPLISIGIYLIINILGRALLGV